MSGNLYKTIKIFAICLFIGTYTAFPAFAAVFEVSPVRLIFTPGSRTDILTVKNDGEEKLSIQVKGYEWSQDPEGKDVYTDTKEIIFFPRIFTLAAKAQRVIRIGLRVPTGQKERTYRIYVEELPTPKLVETTGVRTILRMGIPVFVPPVKTEVKSTLEDLNILAGGKVSFRVTNQGNVHFIVQAITVSGYDSSKKQRFSNEVHGWYLHAGRSRIFTQDVPKEACRQVSRIEVEVSTSAGEKSLKEAIDAVQLSCEP
jgi:fimbrial chaperone protein